jgi:4-amino-4-deoxy-L-arabinose transferase-like glycosyltransferase
MTARPGLLPIRSDWRAPSLPVMLLVVVSLASLGTRALWLGAPCHARCRTSTAHLLIFDEVYYVNAARVIAGVRPPAGQHYWNVPRGVDPNSEHPQLVKFAIAAGIELFGDGPLAWRLGSLLAGSLAILGMWALARGAGAGQWVAFGAAALMAADNLLLVAGRIGTLDIYAVAAMVWAVAIYLRGHPLAAGVLLGVGAACKELAPGAVLVVAVFELMRAVAASSTERQGAVRSGRVLTFTLSTAAVFIILLAIMDRIASPYDPVAGALVGGGVLGHIEHMISYAAHLSSPHGPTGIASYPWEWLVDYKPIVYLSIDPGSRTPAFLGDHPQVLFLGMISPPIMLLALPALALAAAGLWRAVRARSRPRAHGDSMVADGDSQRRDSAVALGDSMMLGLAWFLATFVPYVLLSLIWQRTSYLYYMIIVMPGIYLAVSAFVVRFRRRRWLAGLWVASVIVAAVIMYPFVPLF